jgi:hypothetical protein
MMTPSNGIEAGAVAVDGRKSRPSTCADSRTLAALESAAAFAFCPLVLEEVDALAPL